MILQKAIFTLLASFLVANFAYAQYPVLFYFAGNGNKSPVQYKIHEGIAKLIDGRTLEGRFKYDKWEFPTKNFLFYQNKQTNSIKARFGQINKITLRGADSTLNNDRDSTVFINLNGRLYRALTTGTIKLYDRVFVVNEAMGRIGKTIWVEENGKLIRLSSTKKLNQWYQTLPKKYPKFVVKQAYLNPQEIIEGIKEQGH